MDNFYFSLDKNSKRLIQYLTIDWTSSKQEDINATTTII
jgi:hypothetical protein